MRFRAPLAAAIVAVVALAPVIAMPALASSSAPAAGSTVAAGVDAYAKVVIVVGAVEGSTPGYRDRGDQIYAEAIKYTPNVIKLYSPNATWAKVKAAAQGASIFIYAGHGYGFPSPYRPVLSPSVQDGMGLNEIGGINDKDKKYYGEASIASEIRFAQNAVVLLNGLCYSAGSSEDGDPEPTIAVARQRVDNFASGFIKAGARMVTAESWTGGVINTIRQIFTSDQTLAEMWSASPSAHGHEQSFIPVRNPQFEGRLDPNTWTTGFHRSFVGSTTMRTTDVLAGVGVEPTTGTPDSTSPELWSLDGVTEVTPNFDGDADKLSLLARFSETVGWSAEIRNSDGDVVRSQTGSGHQAAITWDVRVGGDLAPNGDYTWHLHAADAAGNPPLDESGPLTIAGEPPPDTGVLSFKPTTPTMTTSGTIKYALTFAGPVTGLEVADFTRTGNAPKCVVGAPLGSGADYTIAVTGCATGTVGLYLNAGAVADGSLNGGPVGPISAAKVTIDKTAPKATTPKPSLRTGVALETPKTSQRLLMKITWTGTDAGSGIASYDVQRSYDGAAYKTIASATTATTLDWTMTPGHTYKFRVRARDKAGNVSPWTTAYTWRASLIQNTSTALKWTGTWAKSSSTEHSGGSVKASTAAGASVSYKFSGRAIGWVTTLRDAGGPVQVWVDGKLAATVDTHGDTTTHRQVVFNKGWSSYGSHTIKLVGMGGGTATLDAFEVIR